MKAIKLTSCAEGERIPKMQRFFLFQSLLLQEHPCLHSTNYWNFSFRVSQDYGAKIVCVIADLEELLAELPPGRGSAFHTQHL